MSKPIISYYRVSTIRQGASGLGLEAQREKVRTIAAERGAEIIAEFVEVESGRRSDRPKLAEAMTLARKRHAVIAVAKLDRLARDAAFVLRLANEAERNGMGGFLFADLPEVDATTAAGRMVLTVMASVAEFEARRISERTREGLAAAKARGVKLGGPKIAEAQKLGTAAGSAEADRFAANVLPIIAEIERAGVTSLRAIAAALNARGVPTARGGSWAAPSVRNILLRRKKVGQSS